MSTVQQGSKSIFSFHGAKLFLYGVSQKDIFIYLLSSNIDIESEGWTLVRGKYSEITVRALIFWPHKRDGHW